MLFTRLDVKKYTVSVLTSVTVVFIFKYKSRNPDVIMTFSGYLVSEALSFDYNIYPC